MLLLHSSSANVRLEGPRQRGAEAHDISGGDRVRDRSGPWNHRGSRRKITRRISAGIYGADLEEVDSGGVVVS